MVSEVQIKVPLSILKFQKNNQIICYLSEKYGKILIG